MKMNNQITISEHTSTKWRSYAEYVIYKRGIPNFYDGLTNVQRIIINNTPTKFTKSVGVVGAAIAAGYHHGDNSLEGALNGLAKPYGCALNLLEGDGFFGTPVSDEAAATRYTSVKINPTIQEEINKYAVLNKLDKDNLPEKFHLDYPIGALQYNTGIAVGFKSLILPRKKEDMISFLNGEIKEVIPYFKNFKGTIKKADSHRSWIISGVLDTRVHGKKHVIHITEIPVIDKYETFIAKINNILEKENISSVKITNNSQDNIDLILETQSKKDYDKVLKALQKIISSKISENIGFVRDGVLLQYERFEDYLTDYRVWQHEVVLKKMKYDYDVISKNLLFENAKEKFILFMMQGKRNQDQVEEFLKQFVEFKDRLRQIPAYKITQEELESTRLKIKELQIDKKMFKENILNKEIEFNKIKMTHISKANRFEIENIS